MLMNANRVDFSWKEDQSFVGKVVVLSAASATAADQVLRFCDSFVFGQHVRTDDYWFVGIVWRLRESQFVKNLAPDGLQTKPSDQLCIVRVGVIQAHICTPCNNTVTNENGKYYLRDNDRLLHFWSSRDRLNSASVGIPLFIPYTV